MDSILWQRRFGPFDVAQAAELCAELRKVKAQNIHFLAEQRKHFVSAAIPMNKVQRIVKFAAALPPNPED